MSFAENVQFIRIGDEELAIMRRVEFERLQALAARQSETEAEDAADVTDHERAMAEYRAGRDDGLTDEEMGELLAAPTPLAFWRRRRGLTQRELAEKAGLPQAYVSQIEAGKRKGSAETLRALAQILGVRIEGLLA